MKKYGYILIFSFIIVSATSFFITINMGQKFTNFTNDEEEDEEIESIRVKDSYIILKSNFIRRDNLISYKDCINVIKSVINLTSLSNFIV
ncbi:MAG: hypothetical protein JXA99_13480 [Candidatus Lokiarchaeota archaeon]|nr:hypothetical protein [Candidatus Lokiarchaeota archaeon]